MASIEREKALVERYLEVYRTGNLAIADEIIVADFVDHAHPEAPRSPEGVKEQAQQASQALSDLALTVRHMLAEGDVVAFHFTLTGIHTGRLGNLPASGKRVTIHGIDLFRVAGGKLAELWSYQTTLDMLRQLGYSLKRVE